MPLITVREPGNPPVSYRYDQETVTVGRSVANDLVLRDPSVSRSHLEIRQEDGRWVVRDRGSRNGTSLNGSPLLRPEALAPGDEILAGETVLLFESQATESLSSVSERPTRRIEKRPRTHPLPSHREPVIVGRSEAMRAVVATAHKVAPSPATVLITGPNGAGKELVARLIHRRSPRSERPFVVVNCPALPGSLLESELFGVEKGVATGVEARPGRFETAMGGTLLLDEIGDMSPAAQAKILRALEEKQVERVGGRRPIPLDVRILACTNHDLEADMARGAFRRDLYHRLNTVTIEVPPLRDHREDIPELVENFLGGAANPGTLAMSDEALDLLMRYEFPGNVRELRQIVERARLLARGPGILPQDLPPEVRAEEDPFGETTLVPDLAAQLYARIVEDGASFWEVVQKPYLRREISREAVRELIERAYRECGESYKGVARLFGIAQDHKKLLNFLGYHKLGVEK